MIVQAGHPILRQLAQDIPTEQIKSVTIEQLILRMRETMHLAGGVGLAAPQIGLSLRIAVIEDNEDTINTCGLTSEQVAERERVPTPFHAIINPSYTILEQEGTAFFHESCLSLGYPALVSRARAIQVQFYDENGVYRDFTATGWYARILQHEIDHLRGKLYIDDNCELRSLSTPDHFKALWQNKTVEETCNELGIPYSRWLSQPLADQSHEVEEIVEEFASWIRSQAGRLTKSRLDEYAASFLKKKRAPRGEPEEQY